MGAIITDTLKRQFLDKLYNEVSMLDSHNYSVGIGHHDQWDSSDTVPDLVGAPKEELTANEIKAIRKAIRREVAKIFFDLYRKKGTWTAV